MSAHHEGVKRGDYANRSKPAAIPVRKIAAESVPFGLDVSRNGKHVFAVYDGDKLICLGATADEARGKARRLLVQQRMSEQQAK
jgi:hypothetical protein